MRNPASRTIGRWELRKRGKVNAGYWDLGGNQQASMPICAERLQQGNGPVRQLMRDGEWLVPEEERPPSK